MGQPARFCSGANKLAWQLFQLTFEAFELQKPDHSSPGGRSAGRASRDRDSRTRERFVLSFRQSLALFVSESSGIQSRRTASQSQETEGHDRVTEDRGQNTESRVQGTGGQGQGTEDLGQETGSRGQKTADQGLRTENQDIGLGRGTNPGTEETGQGLLFLCFPPTNSFLITWW